MVMSANTLAIELQNLVPTDSEEAAANALANAYAVFASDAEALTPILSTGIDLGKVAMIPALTGMSIFNQGATAIQTGVLAFWSAVAAGLTTSFAGALAITPPTGNATLANSLQPVFDANVASNASLVDATNAIAIVMHAAAIVGGTVTTAGVPVIITPIL